MKITYLKFWAALAILVGLFPAASQAQYARMDLNSNQTGVAPNLNPELINAWGLVQLGTSPIWLSDNGSGFSTLYKGSGLQLGLIVLVPGVGGAQGTPTGIVGNVGGNTDFVFTNPANGKSGRAIFIFATLDGAIVAWNPGVGGTDQNGHSLATIPAAFKGNPGASYTGLAIAKDQASGDFFLYAANDAPNGQVDMYDSTFALKKSFSDPEIPRNYVPYGIQEIDSPSGPQIWVTFTAINKAQGGFVDVFDTDGSIAQHFAVHGPLHSPWGIAKAPADFGPMSNAILVSNNTSRGRVNAFDASGTFLGPLRDANGQAIEIDNLWGIQFGHDGGAANGGPQGTPHNFLFFTAGPDSYANGLFGVITPGN